MTHILHRNIGQAYPVAASARGVVIRDSAGKEYIDASGGAAVSCLGHSHPDVLAAMQAQLDRLAYAHTSFFTTEAAEELAADLAAHAPKGIGHVFYVSGGSEAIEAALKLARQYFVERGEPQRRMSWHAGRAITGSRWVRSRSAGDELQRAQFAPLLIETHHVSPVYEYRERRADETPEALWRTARAGARGQDRRARGRDRHGVRRRDGGRRHARCGPGGARIFPARARNL